MELFFDKDNAGNFVICDKETRKLFCCKDETDMQRLVDLVNKELMFCYRALGSYSKTIIRVMDLFEENTENIRLLEKARE